ncbi:hypothetical protein DFP72DRAFT_933129 [Ephemerocybe angulata]|uniref:Fungal-type protein kinase domain-containing protein n=1 Tax=Ephemerocybe angulata TaxID=980116 RepID=A0A8H6HAG4_9AGAR|nr:hypothetical protein DFP72DRAFT_933129 [Tulosesus angulatus]
MSYGCRKADLDQHLSASHLPVADPGANVTELGAQLSFPGLKLGHPTSHHEPRRVLRIIAAPYYQKLWEAGSVENLQKVWLDCVNAHHEAWQRSGALHQDLSEHTLQVLHLNGETQGILKDWDTSLIPHDPARLSPTYIPAGTPIFMARELLASFVSNPTHWYRHNLEAFFYILIWAALHYNLKEGNRDKKPSIHGSRWMSEDSRTNASAKYNFCAPGSHSANAAAKTGLKPGFEGVWRHWIKPLRDLFHLAHDELGQAMDEQEESDVPLGHDYSTVNGRITFETFMGAIKAPIRTWGDS